MFWSVTVIGFFTFFRKSNLISNSLTTFNAAKQLSRGSVSFEGKIAVLHVTWSKTVQYRQREIQIPLFPIPNSPLCPVRLLKLLLRGPGKLQYPLFAIKGKVPYTYGVFSRRFKKVLQEAGYDKTMFSSHSLRRGGTLFTFKSGVPESLIQVQGDWTLES